MRKIYPLLIALLLSSASSLWAQDTTSSRFISFSDGGELVLFRADTSNFYYLPVNGTTTTSYNAVFNHPNGNLYVLADIVQGTGDRNFYTFEPFMGTLTPAYDPLEQYLSAACVTRTGRVFAMTGNGGIPGEIYEYDLDNQTSAGFTSVNFTFAAGGGRTNLTYNGPTDELWIFAAVADTLIKIDVSTLAETRFPYAMNSDGAVKATYYDGNILWIASDSAYHVNPSVSFDFLPTSYSIPDYLTDIELLDLVISEDTVTLCGNDSTTLRSRYQAHAYKWYYNGVATADTSRNFTAFVPGAYRVLVQIDTAGLYFMWSESIEVQSIISTAAFSMSNDTVVAPTSVTFTHTGTPGATVTWDFGDGGVGSGSPVQHVFTGGTYTVTQYATIGPCTDSITQTILVLVGMDEGMEIGGIHLMGNAPNPFSGETRILLTSAEMTDVTLEVINPMGQRIAVLHEGFLGAGEHEFGWNSTGFASGLYFVRLVTPQGVLGSRMLVQE